MKVTIHISHTDADDLTHVESAARLLGCNVTARDGFMGGRHTELSREMTPATLASLLLQAEDLNAEAA